MNMTTCDFHKSHLNECKRSHEKKKNVYMKVRVKHEQKKISFALEQKVVYK